MFGKELGHEIPASQMQYNADYKETDQEDQCFLYLRGKREQFLHQTRRVWNSLTYSLISSSECAEDSVTKFISLVGATD